MKKIALIVIAIALLLSTAACGKKTPVISDKGTMLFLTSDQVGQYDLNGREGFFVYNEDQTFTPLASTFSGFSKVAKEEVPTRYLWYTDNAYDITGLIPKVEKGSQLVILGNSSATVPQSVTLEKYDYKGVTVGFHVYSDAADKMYIISRDPLASSDAAKISEYAGESSYPILSINGSEKLPLSNVDNNLEMLLGLEEGKYYMFDFFKGTKYITLNLKADTKVFQSQGITVLENPFKITKDGYFIVNLPENLEEGYYYVNTGGLFYFGGNTNE